MDRTLLLLRCSAIFALIGVFMGSHMAGAGGYHLKPIHAHILVVGWLSLFAFAVMYRIFLIPKNSWLAVTQVWTAVIGSIGLSLGMYLYYINPDSLFNLLFFIIGGSVLVISFIAFLIMTFVYGKLFREE
jgi:hypothetical protein